MADKGVSFGYRNVSPDEKRALVEAAFDTVASTYDRANRLFSFGLDGYWRRKGVRLMRLRPGNKVLDVCGGTGSLARVAARRVTLGGGGLAVVLDMNMAMLRAGLKKAVEHVGRLDRSAVRRVQGNAELLPFAGRSFEAVTIGFGLRNIVRLEEAFNEAVRILKPGGAFLAVEFGLPRSRRLRWLYDLYAFRVMPVAAGLLFGNGRPYRYLAESIRVFQAPERTVEMLEAAGFVDARFYRFTAGIALAFLASKPQ